MAARKTSQFLVYGLLGLLAISLVGFGATGLSGTVRTIGEVGDKSISVTTYARALQQDLRAFEAQTGQPLPFDQAMLFGLPQQTLGRVVAARALDAETSRLGISVGDGTLAEQLVDIRAFSGIDGRFDRESYKMALENAGLSEGEFETQLREETARTLVQGSIVDGIAMPSTYADTLRDYVGETRDFTWARLDQTDLDAPLPEPSEDELIAYHQANTPDFTTPEMKRITYAVLLPDMLIDTVQVDETALREAYDSRSAEFNQPERRLVERLVFADADAAQSARAAIDAGETDFAATVAARGLDLADIDLGDVTEDELGAAGADIFAAEQDAVIGPIDTDLGPALFRINGVIPARETPFEAAQFILREELANDRATRIIDQQMQSIDDLLAGGATLEEVAAETEMQLGSIDWFDGLGEDIAAYAAFTEAAADLAAEDFPEVLPLEDGGIVAMRLDEILEPRIQPLAEVRKDVIDGWEASETEKRLRAQAEAILPRLEEGQAFEANGLVPERETGLSRRNSVTGTPGDFMQTVFTLQPGDATLVEGFGAVWLVRLDAINPADPGDEDVAALTDALTQEAEAALARDIFNIYQNAVRARLGASLNQQAINAVHANFQ